MGKGNFEVFQIEEEKMNIMSEYITGIINKYKEEYGFEGAYFIGSIWFGLQVILIIVHNHNFRTKIESLSVEEINRLRDMCGLELKIEDVSKNKFSTERSKIERSDYIHEFALRYGTILYDKNGNLAKMKEELETDADLATYLNYWHEPCEFEPPVKYIKEP